MPEIVYFFVICSRRWLRCREAITEKLERLGRNSIDVQTTVKRLDEMGVRVHCLALGGVDLTSPAGKMTMGLIAAVAQFKRDLLIEPTLSGRARARAVGKKFGRPRRGQEQSPPTGLVTVIAQERQR